MLSDREFSRPFCYTRGAEKHEGFFFCFFNKDSKFIRFREAINFVMAVILEAASKLVIDYFLWFTYTYIRVYKRLIKNNNFLSI